MIIHIQKFTTFIFPVVSLLSPPQTASHRLHANLQKFYIIYLICILISIIHSYNIQDGDEEDNNQYVRVRVNWWWGTN